MLSLRDNYKEKPTGMNEIIIPQKIEIRSRAKIVTEEAYRQTRNYLDEINGDSPYIINYIAGQSQLSEDKHEKTTKELREILNKISYENYDECLAQILKFEYDEKLLQTFKNLIYYKILTESKYFYVYVNIFSQMCKLYNKKTFGNEPKMHIKTILKGTIQKEFLLLDETNIKYPFVLNTEEKKQFIYKLKKMNIKLIAEFYLSGIITKKIIEDCINDLITKKSVNSISLLYELIKIAYQKIYADIKDSLNKAFKYFEELMNDKIFNIPKIKCFILEIFEIRDKLNNNNIEDTNVPMSQLSRIPIRRSSDIKSRKNSINPKDVEYIRRSRFNSISEELKTTKEDNQKMMDELTNCLGADLNFYQCFRLTDEEFDIIKEYTQKMLRKTDKNYASEFWLMMDEIQCEKFIAVGHMIEMMYSLDIENSQKMIEIIISLFKLKLINEEDIKHGMVLGLVNFKNNVIDYPYTKDYFIKFINAIKENKALDEKLLKVYQRTCDNLVKSFD